MTDYVWPTAPENSQQILVSRLFIIQINDMGYLQSCRHDNISQRVTPQRGSSWTAMHASPVTLPAFLINVSFQRADWQRTPSTRLNIILSKFKESSSGINLIGSFMSNSVFSSWYVHLFPKDCDTILVGEEKKKWEPSFAFQNCLMWITLVAHSQGSLLCPNTSCRWANQFWEELWMHKRSTEWDAAELLCICFTHKACRLQKNSPSPGTLKTTHPIMVGFHEREREREGENGFFEAQHRKYR